MFWIKKLIFKFMELGLGLRTCFSLETKDPIFLNFRLTPDETDKVRRSLPDGFELARVRFRESDAESAYWVSFNLYEIKYPKKELARIRKVRCEINTFVTDPQGRKGIYVFCGSPYVSKERKPSVLGMICDFAERLVTFIYGCGKLTGLAYELTSKRLLVSLSEGENTLSIDQELEEGPPERLSSDYFIYNDISFFNEGRTFDLVNVNSSFVTAEFRRVECGAIVQSPFFGRVPDEVLFHRGEIAYLVSSMNLRASEVPA